MWEATEASDDVAMTACVELAAGAEQFVRLNRPILTGLILRMRERQIEEEPKVFGNRSIMSGSDCHSGDAAGLGVSRNMRRVHASGRSIATTWFSACDTGFVASSIILSRRAVFARL